MCNVLRTLLRVKLIILWDNIRLYRILFREHKPISKNTTNNQHILRINVTDKDLPMDHARRSEVSDTQPEAASPLHPVLMTPHTDIT